MEDPKMSEGTEVMLARIDGKLDRMGDAQDRQSEDIRGIRRDQKSMSDDISRLNGLNIQERLVSLNDRVGRVSSNFDQHRLEYREYRVERDTERRTFMSAIRFLWGAIGLTGIGSFVALFNQFWGPQ